MKQPNKLIIVRETIVLLKKKRAYELSMLKQHAHIAYESLQPINILKSTFHDLSSSSEIKNNLVNIAVGVGTSFLAAKFNWFLNKPLIHTWIGGVVKMVTAKFGKKEE